MTPEQRARLEQIRRENPTGYAHDWRAFALDLLTERDALAAEARMADLYEEQVEGLRDLVQFGADRGTAWHEAVRERITELAAEVERLNGINAAQCKTVNAYIIDNARRDERAQEAEARATAAEQQLGLARYEATTAVEERDEAIRARVAAEQRVAAMADRVGLVEADWRRLSRQYDDLLAEKRAAEARLREVEARYADIYVKLLAAEEDLGEATTAKEQAEQTAAGLLSLARDLVEAMDTEMYNSPEGAALVARVNDAALHGQAGEGLEQFAHDLAAKQTPLTEDAAKVLRENLWELYGGDEIAEAEEHCTGLRAENTALREALREAIAAVRRAHEARERYAAWVPCGCPWCTDTPDIPNDSN